MKAESTPRPARESAGPHGERPNREWDEIDEASEASFPASDPPAFTGTAASPSCPACDVPPESADESNPR